MNTQFAPFTKVYPRKPPEAEPSSHWERYPTLVTVEKYSNSGSRAYVRTSYFPRTKLVSVEAATLASQDEWIAANERWAAVRAEKERIATIKKELCANAPQYPMRRRFKAGISEETINDSNTFLTCMFGDDGIYREPNPQYAEEELAWNTYWMQQPAAFRPSGLDKL